MRVVFVTGSLSHGGAERHSITVMNRLAERGHECHAVYIKGGADQLNRIRLRGSGTVRCLEATRYFDPRALSNFAAHLSCIEPAVVVAANAYALMYASIALRLARRRTPLVVTYHSTRLLNMKERLQMMVYRLFFWTADCTVFVCNTQKRYWTRRCVFSPRNEVIHNGVDTVEFRDRWDAFGRMRLRDELGFADADYVIGMLAVLRPEKNPIQLVEAVAALRRNGIPARALMIGDGEMRPQVEARARQLDVEREITITGFQSEIRPYVAACDVVALCSHTETFPLAAIEAMALGRPLVHADVGGAGELIQSGYNGLLFPAGDTGAFVRELERLADRRAAAAMGREARITVETRFSEKMMIDHYESVFATLCREPVARAPQSG